MKTLPLRQFDVARELRRRIKKAFDDAGIEIPVAPAAPASP
jgi:small conductance mechanosensitive channel